MREVAKELSKNEDLGIDEQTLIKIFEGRSDRLMGNNQHFTFEDAQVISGDQSKSYYSNRIIENGNYTDNLTHDS